MAVRMVPLLADWKADYLVAHLVDNLAALTAVLMVEMTAGPKVK